jgi:acetyl esterase
MSDAHGGADPEVRRLLAMLPDNGPDATAEQLRASFSSFVRKVESEGTEKPAMASVFDSLVSGADGSIKVRTYEPNSNPKPGDDCLLFFHGGGWVVGDIETGDLGARALAAGLNIRVVSVDYRLAPEHPFPAPLNDCLAVFQEVRRSSSGAIYVAGESAGANLAAALALVCRDAGIPLSGQLLINPALHSKIDTPSHSRFGNGEGLTSAAVARFFQWYTGSGNANDPHISPMSAERLSGLSPCLIVTAGFDPLRDDGASYAKRMIDAGVATTYLEMPGMMHGWWMLLTSSETCRLELKRMLTMASAFLATTRMALD